MALKKEKTNFYLYTHEQKFWNKNLSICGIDEVGRGCLAGPIVTSAAILHPNTYHPDLMDSKKLTPIKLVKMYQWLIQHCTYTIGINSARIVDKKNIYQATKITMKQALHNLLATTKTKPSLILVDAMPLTLTGSPYDRIPINSLIKGESKSASIAAASIIAKVTRDTIVKRLDSYFPQYGLHQHKGYATKQHQAALLTNEESIIHRHTFLTKILAQKDSHEQKKIFC